MNMRFLNTIAIARSYASHDPQGGCDASISVFYLSY